MIQSARCANCHGKIERVKVREGVAPATWGHVDTLRVVCLLPADTSKVATPR